MTDMRTRAEKASKTLAPTFIVDPRLIVVMLDVIDAAREADMAAFGSTNSPYVNVDRDKQTDVRQAIAIFDEAMSL